LKAVVLDRYGAPDDLRLAEVPTPAPKAGEVLVRVHAASVNDWDLAMLHGTPRVLRIFSGLFTPKAKILGCDVAGRVEAVADDVDVLRPGDEVYGDLCRSGFGAFAEYVCAPATALARKPPAMTFEQAAALPQAGMLAVQGLIDVGRIRSGQTVLLNGAGGGVGTIALQLAKLHDGVEVTAVDRAGKLDLLRAMGADHLIDYRERDFTRDRKRYDLILDVKTDRSPLAYARVLHRDGLYVTVGGSLLRLLQIAVLHRPVSWLHHKHVRLVGLVPNKDLSYLNELFEAGRLEPVIDGSYRLLDLPAAFRRFETGDHRGKIVVTVA
jgi:NADPH:quinone reductase-like Zn-dependent oxidoreductase